MVALSTVFLPPKFYGQVPSIPVWAPLNFEGNTCLVGFEVMLSNVTVLVVSPCMHTLGAHSSSFLYLLASNPCYTRVSHTYFS